MNPILIWGVIQPNKRIIKQMVWNHVVQQIRCPYLNHNILSFLHKTFKHLNNFISNWNPSLPHPTWSHLFIALASSVVPDHGHSWSVSCRCFLPPCVPVINGRTELGPVSSPLCLLLFLDSLPLCLLLWWWGRTSTTDPPKPITAHWSVEIDLMFVGLL